MIFTISFPDIKYDSYSYHLYMQESPFTDKVNYDFMPGRTLTSFVFPIADRIMYLFRALLGFRLGTLPNYLILIVMFYETKKILQLILPKNTKQWSISLFAVLPQTAYIILEQLGTYYIDNFTVVILMEFTYIFLKETNELFKNKICLYYLAFIVGLAACIKITSVIYMVGPLIYILIKNIKDIPKIKWYDYILLVLTALIPLFPYLLNTIIQTKSPVFPYYNSIFKSPYFLEENWLDGRYGPKSILQLIIWPFYIVIYSLKAYESGYTDISFPVGYAIIIFYIIYFIYKKLIKKQKVSLIMGKYTMVLLYFYLVWAKFILGYTRYAGIISVLSTILIINILVNIAKSNKKSVIIVPSILLPSIILCIAVGLGCYQYIRYGSGYNYSIMIEGNLSINEKVKDNIKKVFRDRVYPKYDIEGVWGVINDDSAVPKFLNVDDRIVHLEKGFKTGESEKALQIYWNNVLNNDIYIPLYNFKINNKLNYLDKFHFEIQEIKDIIYNVGFLEKDDTIYILKIKYNENIEIGSGKNKEIFENLCSKMQEEK